MLWSSASVSGRPVLLMIDASGDSQGWEAEFCRRMYTIVRRRGLYLTGSGPLQVNGPGKLRPHLEHQDSFNCMLLFGSGSVLGSYWRWLNAQSDLLPKLFVACSWESYDPVTSDEILKAEETFAPLALAQQTPLTPRESGLYLLKFFTELELHSSDEITGKMVWFSASKAKELLRRRRLEGKFGVRS